MTTFSRSQTCKSKVIEHIMVNIMYMQICTHTFTQKHTKFDIHEIFNRGINFEEEMKKYMNKKKQHDTLQRCMKQSNTHKSH